LRNQLSFRDNKLSYAALQVLCNAKETEGEEKMPSFDIVSEVDLQEARNAVDNASREVESRFDFRGVEATFELNDANKTIKVLSESDFQVNQLLDILRAKLLKRGIEGTSSTCRKISCTAVKPGLLKRS
jgi:uncharacterized protein YajQ (UPF0234 family)